MQKQITILGRSYTLRADEGDDIEHAAAEVDRRLRELQRRAPAFDTTTVALLTSLNLASELQNLKRRTGARLEEADRQLAAVEAVLEAALSQPAAGEDDTAGRPGPAEGDG